MQCLCGCGQEITSTRADARYYSPACRVRAHRVTDNPKNVTRPPRDVTDKSISSRTSNAQDNTISPDKPCNVPVQTTGLLRIDDDLNLNLRRDLGITAWTPDGIFIRPDITIPQVQAIARLIHAKNGNKTPAFRSC